jgi:hypothetical protein
VEFVNELKKEAVTSGTQLGKFRDSTSGNMIFLAAPEDGFLQKIKVSSDADIIPIGYIHMGLNFKLPFCRKPVCIFGCCPHDFSVGGLCGICSCDIRYLRKTNMVLSHPKIHGTRTNRFFS